MREFPKNIRFKYNWRAYQHRVLEDLQSHLEDSHLHIVAPPGSGKTVLGLEVAIRLNNPTLILAPTIAIRNQWIQRFCELFLQVETTPNWISRDIRAPKFLTVSTYQGLHAACNDIVIDMDDDDDDDDDDKDYIEDRHELVISDTNMVTIVNNLKSQGIKTIIVDEAHHLKNGWWYTLNSIKDQLDPIIVGLTATPPYDVTVNEWQRYLDLNGPVDTEISVPELIVEGDLCPHQDYVYFTLPSKKEKQGIAAFRTRISELFESIKTDETLIRAIENHPIWLLPSLHVDWIYTHLSYYSACLIFLNSNGKKISKSHLDIIDDKPVSIPSFDYDWIEILLEFYLFSKDDYFETFADHRKQLENRLRQGGALERKRVHFSKNKKMSRFLSSSISKLQGIKNIIEFEYNQLDDKLRLVVLSDYIRKEFITNTSENKLELNKLGVIPIFETLRRDNPNHIKLGVLTGSLVIIPKKALSAFQEKAQQLNISNIKWNTLDYDGNYILINQTETLKHHIVHITTEIFQNGHIEVLVGTKSLLGEGWDAPAINTLVLATFVGSFVLSNQMRGRAIRTQKSNDSKTANIWHLACMDTSSSSNGDDFDVLKRRFRSFVGVSFREKSSIENGLDRLQIPANINRKRTVNQTNETMFALAANRNEIKQRWKNAIASGVTLIEEIKIPYREERPYKIAKSVSYYKTISSIGAAIIFGLIISSGWFLEVVFKILPQHISSSGATLVITAISMLGFLLFGGLAYKHLRLYLKYRDLSKDIHNIGKALLASLVHANLIHTPIEHLKVVSTKNEYGAVFCHLEGGSTFEKSTFINALYEIISPIDNPRYVIIRKHAFFNMYQQKDYHSVPNQLAKNKRLAAYFKTQWQKHVGHCKLVFTRTPKGRKLLLKSRIKSLAAQFENKIEHVNKWR
ncbi:DEAD/DEAH box helicase family protein [uncultured Psychroserpens sp.]|uniref:DEAD/DEAH box helicase family protein n=1 Tax=uncultured Psychroserpens sp. TaxID=255436 RepID=UPI002616B184|nr:DEAD/DEAH box helicase family protein [uncultured Psychroserpens sp.]